MFRYNIRPDPRSLDPIHEQPAFCVMTDVWPNLLTPKSLILGTGGFLDNVNSLILPNWVSGVHYKEFFRKIFIVSLNFQGSQSIDIVSGQLD